MILKNLQLFQPRVRHGSSPEGDTDQAQKAIRIQPGGRYITCRWRKPPVHWSWKSKPGGRHMNGTDVSPSGLCFPTMMVPVADATGNGCAGLRPMSYQPPAYEKCGVVRILQFESTTAATFRSVGSPNASSREDSLFTIAESVASKRRSFV